MVQPVNSLGKWHCGFISVDMIGSGILFSIDTEHEPQSDLRNLVEGLHLQG
jgi:hypothetical protein